MLGTSVNVLLEYMQIRKFKGNLASIDQVWSIGIQTPIRNKERDGKILGKFWSHHFSPYEFHYHPPEKKCWIGHRQGCGWKNHAADLSLLGTFWGTGKNIRDDFLLKGLGFNVSFGAGTSQCCDPKSSGLRSFFEQPPLYRTCLGYQANHISKKCCREIFFAHETWHVDEVPCQISGGNYPTESNSWW